MREYNKKDKALQLLTETVVERLARADNAIRHAYLALQNNNVAEALVVLEISVDERHLNAEQLELLVAAKEIELLRKAEAADKSNLKRAHNEVKKKGG